MRFIDRIILHCSAVRPNQTSSVAEIDRWHRARGFVNGCGYHYVIDRKSNIEVGRPLDMIGAHCKGYNRHSIGICYEGGLDENGRPADTRTEAQKVAMRQLLERLHAEYPQAIIAGHNDYNPMKACPCFDAKAEYADLQP